MKKLVLFVMAVIGFAGMSVAQDIYSSGYYTVDGKQAIAVYKNGEKLYENVPSGTGYTFDNPDLDYYEGDVYWVRNRVNGDGTFNYADILMNDSQYYLNSPMEEGRHIYDLYRWPERPETGLFAVGCMDVDAVRTAVVWKDDDPDVYMQLGDGIWPSVAYAATVNENGLYVCGYQYGYEETTYHGVIWMEGSTFDFPDGTKIYDITYSKVNDSFFSVGVAYEDGQYKLKVWIDDTELYTLFNNNTTNITNRMNICIDDAGDVYVSAYGGGPDIVWKNGQEIFSTPGYFTSVLANSNGVYYAGSESSVGKIWKDGELLYTPSDCDRITNLYIAEPECTNSEARTLPYFEGFETGETDWACWLTDDTDGSDGDYASYWSRIGLGVETYTQAANGDYCAMHYYGPEDVEQEGWLASPLIGIPADGGNVKMTFNTAEYYTDDYEYEGVWVASESIPDGVELWVAPSDFVSDDWKTVELDLSAYKGMDIRVYFRYFGTYAHIWYVDDVSIEQETAPGQYNINTTVDPAGAGTVEGGGTYPEGELIYLNAIANPGWVFSHWNDDITTNPRPVTVNANATYTAYFLQENYTVIVNAIPAEGGTVTGGGTSYHYEDVATLTATANEVYTFVSWNDGNTDNPRNVIVTGNATYTAFFNAGGTTMYTVTVTSNNPLLGSVTGTGSYPQDAVITISAEPNTNARFVKWDDGNTDNPREVTVTSDLNFKAVFEALHNYTITVESANTSMGTVTGGGTFLEGTEIQIKAIPLAGYYFTSWDDGNADNPRTITVTQDATYKAQFSTSVVQTYTVTVMCNTAQGSVIGNGTYTAGSNVTIAAIPNSGYEFEKWNDDNTQNPRQITVNENKVFVAFFKGTGIGENEGNLMALYPNPANDYIRIEGLEANSEVRIYNAMGALVKMVNAGSNEEIGIGDLAAGLYLVRCGNATLRFVKEQ